METVNGFNPPSNYDEIFMQRSLMFADSLQDLRNVRSQLYSAAEFFEDAYHKPDHDPLLFERVKDYVSKALISTIDHLGSVTSKVNSFLDENVDEAFETNLRVLCIKQVLYGSILVLWFVFYFSSLSLLRVCVKLWSLLQRLQTCQTFSNREGLSQQSLVIQIPKYHKQYLLPDGRFSEGIEAEKPKAEPFGLRRGRKERNLKEFGSDLVDFSFAKAASNKGSEKRSRSASPSRFKIKRSGSISNPSTSPISRVGYPGSVIHRSVSPLHTPEARRSYSLYSEKERRKDIEVYSKKTRNLFKAFLSMQMNKSNR